jgi:zinc transport system substrate-binding protein
MTATAQPACARAAGIAAWLALLSAAALVGGCGSRPRADKAPAAVIATNSYLVCAAREFLDGEGAVAGLAGPGMCPGHFDLKPSQAAALRGSALLLRFDFQANLDERLAAFRGQGPGIAAVSLPEGLCIPSTYLQACRQVGEALVGAGLVAEPVAAERLKQVQRRLEGLEKGIARSMGTSAGAPVLASGHQAAFCRHLGLDVVGTFSPSDTVGIGEMKDCLERARKAKVRCVVGNLQEGEAAAKRLSERLGVPAVMFSNFPAMTGRQQSFDALVGDNVALLAEVL